MLQPIPEVRRMLGGISRGKLYELIDEGHLRRVKVGSRTFITTASIDAYVESLTGGAA